MTRNARGRGETSVDLQMLVTSIGGGGGAAWFITGAIKSAFLMPSRAKPLLAIAIGSIIGAAVAWTQGGTDADVLTGALAGIMAVGAREGIKAIVP